METKKYGNLDIFFWGYLSTRRLPLDSARGPARGPGFVFVGCAPRPSTTLGTPLGDRLIRSGTGSGTAGHRAESRCGFCGFLTRTSAPHSATH